MNVFSKIFSKNEFSDNCFISLDIGSEIVKALVSRQIGLKKIEGY